MKSGGIIYSNYCPLQGDLQVLHFLRLHDELCSAGVGSLVQPAVRVHRHFLAPERGYVYISLDALQEGQ